MTSTVWRLALLALAMIFIDGCSTSCEDACQKIIEDCEAMIPSYNVTQCTEDCSEVQDEYEAHDYFETKAESFQEQLDCIQDATCESLLDTETSSCYLDYDDLYIFF